MFFCSGTIRTERPGEDWVWDEKSSCRAWNFDFHARHKKIEISCPAWLLFSSQPSLLSVEPHFMPGMKSGSTCPAWKSTLYGQYENWLHMLGTKTNLKITWSLSKFWVDTLSGYKVSFLFRLKRHFLLHRRIQIERNLLTMKDYKKPSVYQKCRQWDDPWVTPTNELKFFKLPSPHWQIVSSRTFTGPSTNNTQSVKTWTQQGVVRNPLLLIGCGPMKCLYNIPYPTHTSP